jgi:hypothetical protein
LLSSLWPGKCIGVMGGSPPAHSVCMSPSAEDRLPKSLRFAESDVIIFVVRASGVHELGYGHKWDWEA